MDDFVQLLDKHRDEFFRYILRTVWDSRVAEDTFAAAVLAGYENFHKFKKGTNFRAWMYRIITNKCFVANREIMRTPESLDEAGPSMAAVADESGYADVLADPEGVLEQCGDEVVRALRKLKTAERSCILLRGVEEFSYKEIAEILEIPVGTVMTHLARGRAKLRKELTAYARETGIVRSYPRLLDKKGPGDNVAREGNDTQ